MADTSPTHDAQPARRWLALGLGPVAALLAGASLWGAGLEASACWCAAIAALCAVWWVTEALPIPATSLIPFAALPLTGVMSHKEVASAYGHHLILLLMAGFILSTAMERSGAHRRLALVMVRACGRFGPRGLVFGFMLASAGLSMWISNTATTLMLLPIALAAMEPLDRDSDEGATFARALLLGVAYAASVGGMGTPVGTPPNVILMAAYSERVGEPVDFVDWMRLGVPVVVVLLPLVGLWLTRRLPRHADVALPEATGPWTPAQRRVLAVFGLTALAWVTRASPGGGWAGLLGLGGAVGDSTVGLAAVVALFLIPDGRGERLLDWESASKIPWGLLLLFAGGIALAKGFGASGLSAALGAGLAGLATWPTVVMIAAICLGVTFLTEVTSNTATTALLMPILAEAGLAAGLDPALMMVPAALSASCAFMLPVATAPNAIVFGTGRVSIRAMMREGFALNLIGAVVITNLCLFLMGD